MTTLAPGDQFRRRYWEIHMNFKLACLIGMVLCILFGLAFALLPEQMALLYGLANWSASANGLARLFGDTLLFSASALYAVRDCTDAKIQQTFARLYALVSLIGGVISVQWVMSGLTNALMWSTVGIYGFLMLMWGSVGFRSQA